MKAPMKTPMKARITVLPRPEILDPQGKAILSALERLGFSSVSDLRAGKSFELALVAHDRAGAERELRAICEQMLCNPLLEHYQIELDGEAVSP